eukprot:CAMPEP_0171125494 /NCGR_PEP_ID=MMETSP0766_2-20121228/111357_1 /TAXON_ID=439317 /ORGANISM="Gambierdiscus australes, Strain CAWD 149" /LENGTH=73 /DNA_ID=CAMNT_0011588481 /DNA_START=43 /DNA_END=260 /DNA_ORIENTATION=+
MHPGHVHGAFLGSMLEQFVQRCAVWYIAAAVWASRRKRLSCQFLEKHSHRGAETRGLRQRQLRHELALVMVLV